MDLNSNVISDLHNAPNKLCDVFSDNPSYVRNVLTSHHLIENTRGVHSRHVTTPDISNNTTLRNISFHNRHPSIPSLTVSDFSLHKRNHSTTDVPIMNHAAKSPILTSHSHQLGNNLLGINDMSDLHMLDIFLDNAQDKSSPFRHSHTRHISSNILLDKNYRNLDKSFANKNLSLDDISRTNTKSSTLDNSPELTNEIKIQSRSIPNDIDLRQNIKLSNNALLCFKTLVSPISIFFHIGRLALASITTTFSFATAFAISDVIFFSFLDNFDLSYARYILLGITGIVAAFSIKGILSSLVNLFLSVFKGTYSWYFSLVDPNCSFSDFLFGLNEITVSNS